MYSEARCDPLASEISEFHQHTSSISKRANVAPPILAKPFPNLRCSRSLLPSREKANVYFGNSSAAAQAQGTLNRLFKEIVYHEEPFSFSNSSFAFCSSASCSSLTFGYFKPRDFSIATMISDTQRRVNHLRSAGIMNHGAHSLLV
jgi:hypothetical protein